MPPRYAEKNVRDSAYGSASQPGEVLQNCYQYGDVQLGQQMLTDPDEFVQMDRDIQLSGISARDIAASPGYAYSYGVGLDDDELMGCPTAGEGDGFYMMS